MPEIRIESPYLDDEDCIWLRGNLHTHSTLSDGTEPMQSVIRRYAEAGYDFLMLSDHDVRGEVNELDPCGMLLISGNEVSAEGPHILHVDASTLVKPQTDRQAVIDAINRDGSFAILCHPNWREDYDHHPFASMQALQRYQGVEIFNGGCLAGPGSAYATDKWGRLLALGRKVWGFANDDSHRSADVGIGWNVVLVRERTREAVVGALRAGSFYASSGVTIESLSCDGPEVRIEAPNAEAIAVIGAAGQRLHLAGGPSLRYDTSDLTALHFRFECYGRANTFAWTQPMRVLGGLAEKLAVLAEQTPSQKVFRAENPPRMSGVLDDPLWRQAPPIDTFLHIADGTTPPVKTEVRCILAGSTLFIGVRCEEPHLDAMKLNVTQNGFSQVWTDDSVELFLDTEGQARHYYQIMANAKGVHCVSQYLDRRAKPTLQVLAGRGEAGWSLEIAIPLAGLDVDTAPGASWGCNICRNRHPERGSFVWSWVGGSNHTPTRFGRLEF